MKDSRSKKYIAIILMALMSIGAMSSCKAKPNNEVSCRTREDKIEASPKVNLNVQVEYGGYGEDGEPLGSGEFEYDLECFEGMQLYEDGNGYYKEEVEWNHEGPSMVIKEINDDGVRVETPDGEMTIPYGESVYFDPFYWTCDGINFFSTVTFEDPNN